TMLQGQLPRTLKEMIGIVLSQANQSPYALQVHLHSLSVLGISEAVLKQLVNNFEECPLPARPKAVIRFGLLCATQPQMLDTSHFAELRDEGLTDSEITEVMATAMLFLSINRYTDSIALEIDQL
ncbi:MAG: carboxymuconolactone decarboxylase family protein, partial [Caldilineaceae bacterium]|nr:carboxymuconolactone decarboxylase family protein [Caldilineaceae bacterium]